jgi:hypothetical protein
LAAIFTFLLVTVVDTAGGVTMALSFAKDIRPLFRDTPDVEAMKPLGLDLSSYDDVKEKAAGIYNILKDGNMPCDGAWPESQLGLFKRWIDEGMAP